MSTDKTLADVQPGGRVRLGDHDEKPPQELPELIVTRGDGIPLPDQAAGIEEFKRQCLRRIEAEYPHLSAQPSPGGQGGLNYERMFVDACAALAEVSRELGCDPEQGGAEPILAAIAELREAVAARQPVRSSTVSDDMMDVVDRLGSEHDEVDPRAWDHMLIYAPTEKLAARLAARQPVGYSGVRTCGDERPCINCYSDQGDCLGPAPSQDPTHQPVLQEPVAWISRIRCVGPEYGKEIYGKLPVQSLNPLYYEHIPLYAAPAQAVDLGLMRDLIDYAESGKVAEPSMVERMRAMIGSQAVGNG